MASAQFDKVVEDVKALDASEQLRLRNLLDVWLAHPSSEGMTENDQIDQFLLKEGLISGIPPKPGVKAHSDDKPIALPGKPGPKTAVEEEG
jgi:hypothetical protein